MYAYSVSYFAFLPILGVAVLVALARRREIAPMRVLCLAVAFDYLVSLPWFLLFPVPERWAYPESSAMLLSDLWSSRLIDAIRPISALNNSFPSTHVSLTVVVIAVCWLFHVRLRNAVTALGITVILATFLLGIHWLADILAGVAAGGLSVAIARRLTDTSEREPLALALGHHARPRKVRVGPLAKSAA
jgi:membrane-associated phospholipid phosphatase